MFSITGGDSTGFLSSSSFTSTVTSRACYSRLLASSSLLTAPRFHSAMNSDDRLRSYAEDIPCVLCIPDFTCYSPLFLVATMAKKAKSRTIAVRLISMVRQLH